MRPTSVFPRFPFYLILVFIISMPVFAQTGGIQGMITDASTGDPLPGANVLVQGTNFGAAASLTGEFTIPRVPAGTHRLIVSYIGYDKVEDVEVEVRSGEVSRINIGLRWIGVTLDEVTISAQARGQITAINQQMASRTITNVVSGDRIRELPDVNAAESIGRLPGVSIHRSGGEANMISIRGLSPKYNTVTVNGVRVPSTGGDDRSVDLSLISSNMLAGIEVTKSPTADMDADVLGGTVDLKLREAPDRLDVSFSLQGGYNQLQDYYGNYNLIGSISNRFLENRLGVIANFNLDHYDRSADKFAGTYRERVDPITFEHQIIISEINLREENLTRGRTGGSLLFDYRIPDGKITLNSFYNQLNWDELVRINRYENRPNERHRYDLVDNDGRTSLYTGGIGMERELGWLSFDVGAAYSATRTKIPEMRRWIFVQEPAPLEVGFTLTPATRPREVLDNRILNENRTWMQEASITSIILNENRTSTQANVTIPFFMGNQIDGFVKTGVKFQWLDRLNDETFSGRAALQYGNNPDPNQTLLLLDAHFSEWGIRDAVREYNGLPIWMFLDDYRRTDFLDGEYDLGFALDLDKMNQITNFLMQQMSSDPENPTPHWRNSAMGSLGRDYDGVERYQAGYVMAEFNYGSRFTFIPGLRYEGDYSRYNGQFFREVIQAQLEDPPADFTNVTSTRKNDFFLPMVHAVIRPLDWLQIRLARTETLTRPDYIHYAPISRQNQFGNYARVANAELKPAHSKNYDAALTFHQNHLGFFTIAGFHKKIDDLIFQTTYHLVRGQIEPLQGMIVPEHWYSQPLTVDTYINNPFPSTYKGFELDWQTNFWYLPSPFQGIVLNVNYTRIWSEMEKQMYFRDRVLIQPPNIFGYVLIDSTRTTRMPDQPSHIVNATIGYDFRGFSARLMYLFQTDRVTFIDTNPAYDNFTGDYNRWDFTIRQIVGRGVQLFANFNNLNNRPDRNFRGEAMTQPTYIEYYGFTMDVGVRYNF
jgi:TonB-dependent receptor